MSEKNSSRHQHRNHKSSHHRHRNGNTYHRSPMEKNRIEMRKETFKALAWILPAMALVIGGALWSHVSSLSGIDYDDNADLGKLGMWMTIVGGACFVLAIAINWIIRLNKFFRERRERADDVLSNHNRSSHHSSRHSHGSHSGGDGHRERRRRRVRCKHSDSGSASHQHAEPSEDAGSENGSDGAVTE